MELPCWLWRQASQLEYLGILDKCKKLVSSVFIRECGCTISTSFDPKKAAPFDCVWSQKWSLFPSDSISTVPAPCGFQRLNFHFYLHRFYKVSDFYLFLCDLPAFLSLGTSRRACKRKKKVVESDKIAFFFYYLWWT